MLWTYLISADIANEAYRDGFNEAVKRLGDVRKTGLTTVWLARNDLTASGILSRIEPHAGPDAQIIVIEVKPDFAVTDNLSQTKIWLSARV